MVLTVTSHHDSNVPRALTPIVGREQELDRLLELLDDPDVRLVTIIGPGGVGKTRLAMELARTLVDEFAREAVFVSLAAIREPDLVPAEICRVLGLTVPSGMDIAGVLLEALRHRDLLLVLDNFEQVLPAADELVDVLARCAGLRIVVTSRAALGVAGEYRLPLAPLAVTPAARSGTKGAMEPDAVKLFIARARAIRPGLTLDDQTVGVIAEICSRVDGLPLAIELAAARLNVLSPQALLARLDTRLQVLGSGGRGVPDRLKTMRQAIAWSYDLLRESEQSLFRRLSVFAGGFPLSAAEAVGQDPGQPRGVLDTLAALVDHSLVNELPGAGHEPRYAMLETLREYGIEQLAALGEERDARARHAAWCIELAETAAGHLDGRNQVAWMARLDADWDNLRSACSWANAEDEPVTTLRILGASRKYISARGHAISCRPLLDHALAATDGSRTTFRCRALLTAGSMAEDQRELSRARALLEEARTLAIDIGDNEALVFILIYLAHEAHDRGDFTTADNAASQAIAVAATLEQRRIMAAALAAMGNIHYFRGALAPAIEHWDQARSIVADTGDQIAEAALLGNLGAAASALGDVRRAVELQEQAADVAESLNDATTRALAWINMAENLRTLGELDRAATLIEAGTTLLRERGLRGYEGQALHMHASIAFRQGNLAHAVGLHRSSLSLLVETGDQRSLADSGILLAELSTASGTPAPAIELVGGATSLWERLGIQPSPAQEREVSELTTRLKRAVRPSQYEHHWTTGRELDTNALVQHMFETGSILTGVLSGADAAPAPPVDPIDILSTREREVLRLLVEGQSAREIGDALFISPRTATTHINNIYVKLGVNTRAQAVALAVRADLGN